MGFGFRFSHRHELRHEHGLSHRHEIKQMISKTIITPDGTCPKCGHTMTEDDVRAGWRRDPLDFTTECPKCHTRFEAHLLLTRDGESVGAHVYLCQDQLFHGLQQAERGASKRLGLVYLAEKHPQLLWNMIRHFGSYKDGLQWFRKK